MVKVHAGPKLVGHISRDATAIAAPERPAPEAVTATACKLACILYHRLKYQEEFVALDLGQYAANAQAQRLRHLTREAKKLGFQLVEKQAAA